jgi:hypothetical protein
MIRGLQFDIGVAAACAGGWIALVQLLHRGGMTLARELWSVFHSTRGNSAGSAGKARKTARAEAG